MLSTRRRMLSISICLLVAVLHTSSANANRIQRLLARQEKRLSEVEGKLDDVLSKLDRKTDTAPDLADVLINKLGATIGARYGAKLQEASHIFYNGDIITVRPQGRWEAEAVAVHGGKILAVGDRSDVMLHMSAETELIDLQGDTLLPGLIEPHTHPILAAWTYGVTTDVAGFDGLTKVEALIRIREAIARASKGSWVIITGMNPILVPGMSSITLTELNELAPDHKLCIIAQSIHVAHLNQNALDAMGITKETVVAAGEFLKDEDGELTGVAYETGAIGYVFRRLPSADNEPGTDNLLKTQLNSYAKNGYTTIAGAGLTSVIPNATNILKTISREADCPVRVVVYRTASDMKRLPELQNVEPCRPGTDNFCHIGVKWWADGTPYAGAVGLKQPFMDSNLTRSMGFPAYPNYGHLMWEHNELHEEFLRYHQRGFQLAVHTQGPRAVEQVLDIYSSLLKTHPRQDHRHRLEHNAFIEDAQLGRAKQLGATVSFYPDHVWYFGRALKEEIVGELAKRVMPFRSALDAGLEQTVHTDTPCTPLGPMRLFKTMATRAMWRRTTSTPPGEREETLGPDQAIPVDEVIKAFTINSAKQLLHENFIGSIEVGKVADFTRLSENPRKVDPFDLDTIEIVATYRAGEQVQGFNVDP